MARKVAWVGMLIALCGVVVGTYYSGRRAGRGAACFEVAIHIPDQDGRTLHSEFLSKPGSISDYIFLGDQLHAQHRLSAKR